MEDILASIRRILNEDEAPAPHSEAKPAEPDTKLPPPPAEANAGGSGGDDGVLMLDEAMLVTPPPSAPPAPPSVAPAPAAPAAAHEPLLAPEAAHAAASSVQSLVQTLTAERHAPVYRGGPTIEDMVREELRPMLKTWLDEYLPPLVERLVRQEIERVTSRA